MKFVKLALMGFGVLGAVLAVAADILSAGGHGALVLALCLLPVALGGYTLVTRKGMPRWASIASVLGLLIVGMKTSEATDLEGVMMSAAAGILCGIALIVRPDKTPASPAGEIEA